MEEISICFKAMRLIINPVNKKKEIRTKYAFSSMLALEHQWELPRSRWQSKLIIRVDGGGLHSQDRRLCPQVGQAGAIPGH